MSDNLIEQRLKRRAVCLTIVTNPRNVTRRAGVATDVDPFRAVHGRGLMWTDSGVASLDNGLPPDLDHRSARGRSGQWFTAFHRRADDTYRFVTDVMGYYRLYYSTFRRGDDHVVVVGDNQTSVVGELRRLGRTVAIDWAVAASHLLSTHTIMQSSFSHRTMFEGIRSLPAGAELVVDPSGVHEETRDLFSAPDGFTYEELLATGIDRAQQQIRALAESPIQDKRHALSGGRDSRVAMAMTVSAGVHEEFAVMTADPRTSRRADSQKVLEKDLQVAAGLRGDLGLEWARESGITGVRHDVHSSLDIFQSRYAGARFTWPGSVASTWPQVLRLEVHGGSGELIRRAYQNVRTHRSFQTLDDRPDTVLEDAHKLFPTVVRHSRHMSEDLRDEAAGEFARSLSLHDDLPMSEQLNLHYANFRNRDHFGEIIHRYAKNALVLYPLAQPEFLQASRLLEPEERARGRVAYDIIRMTCPSLNEFPFDDGHWQEPFALDRTERLSQPEPAAPEEIQGFFSGEDEDTRHRAAVTLLNDPTNPVRAFDGPGAAASFASHNVWDLLDYTDVPLTDLDTVIPTLVAQNGLVPGNTAAKLETMTTIFTGRHTPYEAVLLSESSGNAVASVTEPGAWHAASAETVRLARVDPLVFHVDLTFLQNQAVVSIRCDSDKAQAMEWAVYLYDERNKIAQRWYETNRTAKFSLEDLPEDSRMRALVFARSQAQGDRVLKRFSAWQRR